MTTTAAPRQATASTARWLTGFGLALEGGTAVGSLVVAAALSVWGWRLRATGAGTLLLAAFPLAALAFVTWGLAHGGFPAPSELGWP